MAPNVNFESQSFSSTCPDCLANNCDYCNYDNDPTPNNPDSGTGTFDPNGTGAHYICENDYCSSVMQKWDFKEGNSSVMLSIGRLSFYGKASLTKTRECSCTGNAYTLPSTGGLGELSFTDMTMAGYSGYGLVGADHTMMLTQTIGPGHGSEFWQKYFMHDVSCYHGCD